MLKITNNRYNLLLVFYDFMTGIQSHKRHIDVKIMLITLTA